MKILREVKCKINDNSLVGKVVVKDNMTAEGIMIDTETKNKYFVFGRMTDDSFICYASDLIDEDIYSLRIESTDSDLFDLNYKKIAGELYLQRKNKDFYIGNSEVNVLNPIFYRDINDGEIIGLLFKIQALKSKMNSLVSSYYNLDLNKTKILK